MIFSLLSFGADHDFSYGSIPKTLLENAKAVIRYHETTFEVQSVGKAELKVNYAITILNESALENAFLRKFYDKFTHINSIRGTVYDSNGEKVERVEKDKIHDFSAISGFSIFEDHRMIYIQPQYRTVPFTVEYSFNIVFNGILDYPDYYLVEDYNMAVEQANLLVITPDSIGIRYLERNISMPCKIEKSKTGESYSWSFNNIPPIRYESFSPPIADCIPSILLAPKSFKLKNKFGNAETWENFGLWIYELTKGRGELCIETQAKVLNMISGKNDIYEKIAILYKYFQDKTRYASIQIGLGGWQPFEAETVDRLSYGDCKALTNYMQALLSVAGINSYYTLVNAGDNAPDIIKGFTANQYNHVILCVPLDLDTLWLECTDQNIPMGYLGTFTDDRTVLVVKENGSYLSHTTKYDEQDNIQNRVSHFLIDEGGSGIVDVTTAYHGVYYDKMLRIFLSDDMDKRKNIELGIQVGNFKLVNFTLAEYKDLVPYIEETLNLSIPRIGISAGDMMLIVPNQLSKRDPIPNQISKRKNTIFIRRSKREIDTAYFTLPQSYSLSGNHFNESVISNFGEYHATTTMIDKKIQYIRNLVVYKGIYPSESYNDFINFFEKVANADNKKLALEVMK